jgi:hypothetical protein
MTYHRMCGEPVPWIADVTEWVAQETGKPVWPVIQAHGEPRCPWNPYQLSTAEFQQALLTARSGESSGAIVFTLESVFADKRVTALTENFCRT